jgi:hypothetical protein
LLEPLGFHADVLLAFAGDLPQLGKARPHVVAVGDQPSLDPLGEPFRYLALRAAGLQACADLDRILQRFMPWLAQPGPCRVAGLGPTGCGVPVVAQRVEVPLPPWGRRVQALARRQVDARGEHVDVRAVAVVVAHCGPRIAVGVEAGEGQALEVVQHLAHLLVGGVVAGRPRDDSAPVPVLELEAVGHGRDLLRVAPQRVNAAALEPEAVVRGRHIVGGALRAALAVAEELDVHQPDASKSASPGATGSPPASPAESPPAMGR